MIHTQGGGSGSSTDLGTLLRTQQAFLPAWLAALEKVKDGTANTQVAWVYDSTGFSAYSINAATGDFATGSLPSLFSDVLNGAGVPASCNNFFGDANGVAGPQHYPFDPRISVGSGWNDSAVLSLCGKFITAVSGTGSDTNPYAFTPTEPTDTLELYYLTSTSARSFTVGLDATAPTTINSNTGAVALTKTTLTGKLGYHTAKVLTLSSIANPIGFHMYNSAVKQAQVIKLAWRGSAINDWIDPTNTYSAINTLNQFSPSLWVVEAGQINDWNVPTALATYITKLQTLITKCKSLGGDVVLVSGNPSQIATHSSLAVQQQYVSAMQSLAALNGCLFIDVWTFLQTWEIANTNGLMYDDLHPNGAGYKKILDYIASFLIPTKGNGYASSIINPGWKKNPAISYGVAATPFNVLATMNGAHFTNEDATAKNYNLLPTAAAGLKYRFTVQDADGMRIVANSGDTIRIEAAVSAVAGYTESTAIGSAVELEAINATEWIANYDVGTWSVV